MLEMNFELKKLKLQAQNQSVSCGVEGVNATGIMSYLESKIDIQKLLPTFRPETENVTLFLVHLERKLNLLKIPEHLWLSYNSVLNNLLFLRLSLVNQKKTLKIFHTLKNYF